MGKPPLSWSGGKPRQSIFRTARPDMTNVTTWITVQPRCTAASPEQEVDRAFVRALPGLLAQLGYHVVRRPG